MKSREEIQEIINAIWSENVSDFLELIKSDQDANVVLDEGRQDNVLSQCCRMNLAAFVEHLLRKNVNCAATEIDGNTALHVAAYSSDAAIVEMLLAHDSSAVNARNNTGQTPLMFAAKRCAPDVVDLLLHFGADPTMSDLNGNTALHWSLTERHPFPVFSLTFEKLYRDTLNLDLANGNGDSVLDYMRIARNRWDEYDFLSMGDSIPILRRLTSADGNA